MEKDLQAKKKLREVKLSEHNGELSIEIDGVSIPNVCGYKLVVNPKDPLVAHLTIQMEFFRSDVQEDISFSSGYFIGNDNPEKTSDIEPTQEQLKRAIEKCGTEFNPSIQISKH